MAFAQDLPFKTITIGEQTWSTENVALDHFLNGDLIKEVKSEEEWKMAGDKKIPAMCWYNNDRSKGKKGGRLYNWYVVSDPRGFAPKGWHIPTEKDWELLIKNTGGKDSAGFKLKCNTGWNDKGNGSNVYGFAGYPSGYRSNYGVFYYEGGNGDWWSSTENTKDDAWYRFVSNYYTELDKSSIAKGSGLSVRFIKDYEIKEAPHVPEVAKVEIKEAPHVPEVPKEPEVAQVMRGGGDPLKGLNVSAAKSMVIGNYYALIIGIDRYKNAWPQLNNAVNDATSVEKTLKLNYKFDFITTLYNDQATRDGIIQELEKLVRTVKENDNVFIFFSGHGEFRKELNKGFWVPIDAEVNSTSKYISNSDIQTYITGIKSKHTLLVSDACFSGDIFRGNTISTPFEESDKYYREVQNMSSRQALTSGGIEPVMDGGKEGHSIFTFYFLKVLEGNQGKYFDASQLYTKIKIPVINNSEQTPKFAPIKNAGDEGGQFIFIRK